MWPPLASAAGVRRLRCAGSGQGHPHASLSRAQPRQETRRGVTLRIIVSSATAPPFPKSGSIKSGKRKSNGGQDTATIQAINARWRWEFIESCARRRFSIPSAKSNGELGRTFS